MHPTQKALIFGHRFDLPTHLRLPFCGIFLPMFLPLQKHLFSFWRYAAFFSHRTLDTSRWITHCSNAKWLFTPFHTYKLSGIQLHIAAGFCNFPPGHKLFIIFYSSRTPISPWSSEWELCQRFHTDMGNGQNMVLFPQRGRLSLAKGVDILIRRISNHGGMSIPSIPCCDHGTHGTYQIWHSNHINPLFFRAFKQSRGFWMHPWCLKSSWKTTWTSLPCERFRCNMLRCLTKSGPHPMRFVGRPMERTRGENMGSGVINHRGEILE